MVSGCVIYKSVAASMTLCKTKTQDQQEQHGEKKSSAGVA
jgi:hypothetical protein